jgi:hypothetical protein
MQSANRWFSGPRYAAPSGTFVPVAGFLPKPFTGFPWSPQPQRPEAAQPLTTWQEERVVVLLGEAGIGKSFELRQWFEARRSASVLTTYIDLRTESTDGLSARWHRRTEIAQWLSGDRELELFLDGIDEFPGGPRNFNAALNAFIEGIDVNRLRLRMTSRPAFWTEDLAQLVAAITVDKEAAILSLLPIEADDALEAAKHLKVPDPERFLAWVHEQKAEPLASRPLTLQMLCKTLASGQQPPLSRAELFERYLGQLFLGHREHARERKLAAPQRVEVAARIAAVTLFANRPLIVDFDRGTSSALAVGLEEIIGGYEGDSSSRVVIDRPALQETIDTGPFVRLDHGSYLWSSRSYEEYLGARYLAGHASNLAILDVIFVNTTDPQRRIVPILRGALGWLADLRPEAWSDLATRDPRALLDSDLTSRSPAERTLLVEAWLQGIEAGAFTLNLEKRLGFLRHEGISKQLDGWLDITQRNLAVVQAAAYLAGVTAASACTHQLISLVEQPWADDPDRTVASLALRSLQQFLHEGLLTDEGRGHVINLCRRVLKFNKSLDPNDGLLGYALDILWPEHLPTSDLLANLRTPHRQFHYGSYRIFISRRLPEQIEEYHLAAAIRWSANESMHKGNGRGREYHADEMLENLLTRATNHLDNPEILDTVLRIIFDSHIPIKCPTVLSKALSAQQFHSTLISAAIKLEYRNNLGPRWIIHKLKEKLGINVSIAREAAWEGLAKATEQAERERFAAAVEAWTPWNEEAAVTRLLTEGPRHPELVSTLENIYKLGDQPTAIVMESRRRIEEERREWALPEPESVPLNPPIEQQICKSISDSQDGDSSTFWNLLHLLYRQPTDDQYVVYKWHTPIWETHGWHSIDDVQKSRIVEACRAFLIANDPQTEKWLGKQDRQAAHAMMGVAALRLMHAEGILEKLNDNILARWAPAVVDHEDLFRNYNSGDPFKGSTAFEEILSLLLIRTPLAVADTWVKIFEGESQLLSLRAFHQGWRPAVRDAFLAALNRQTDPNGMGHLLVELLRRGVEAAYAFADRELSELKAESGTPSHERGLQAAFALLRTNNCGVATVLQYLESQNHDEAHRILLRLGEHVSFDDTLADGWPVDLTGHFAELLARCFPPPDKRFDRVHFIGPEEILRRQRDLCLDVLLKLTAEAGWAAVDELARLERIFPAWSQVSYKRIQAVERAGVTSWSPPAPAKVLRIVREGVSVTYPDGALRRLESFLLNRFGYQEIQMFIRKLPQGDSLEAQLVGPHATRAQLASSAIEVIARAGKIDETFFSALLKEREAFEIELQEIAVMFGLKIAQVGPK